MEVYFDNSATTRCSKAGAELMQKLLLEDYGNPSSLHNKGMEAENYMKSAKKTIAKSLKVSEKQIYFISGGTEGNNLAIFGSVFGNPRVGKHVITTAIEHPAVANPMKHLEELGYEVSYLSVDAQGHISLEELQQLLREDTVLVSIMHVNNEIGTIEPVEEAAALIHSMAPKAIFHVDAIQSYGKVPLYPEKMGIDIVTVSGHKIHGPKGSGFIYINPKIKVQPQILGGGQEEGFRSGTQNVPAIAALGVAVEEIFADFEGNRTRMYELRHTLMEGLKDIPGVSFNGDLETGAPHILSVSVADVRAEVLLHALEDRGIYVSAGSACSSNKPSISKTLQAIGLDEKLLGSTVRLSFSIHSTEEDVVYCIDTMKEIIPMLQKYMRR
ncbi:MAG: cysteine desulfurase [Lachnospiraceae bacterium]|nr:cysteine desulfurase [Lachnospiraceae bacterium]